MRNPTLHGLLEAFVTDAAMRLSRVAEDGAEVPFEVVETPSGGRGRRSAIPLYCYRPLTAAFIREHLGVLVTLPTYAPAARSLEYALGTETYLRARGQTRIPERSRERADVALWLMLSRVFEERSAFAFDDARFARAYEELERSLYNGLCVTELIVPLRGLELDAGSEELVLGDGLSIVRARTIAEAPAELWGPDRAMRGDEPGGLVMMLRISHEHPQTPPIEAARTRFRRALAALRLYEHGAYSIGPVGFLRLDDGAWAPVAAGTAARGRGITRVAADQEDELRAFCNLVARRLSAVAVGEVGWALARFEMGCDRTSAREALTDYLLALRALLEPEGPGSGRMGGRLAAICAAPAERAALAERAARAAALERSVILGMVDDGDLRACEVLVDELADHLRAILRDIVCGHLDADVRGVADDLLTAAAAAV